MDELEYELRLTLWEAELCLDRHGKRNRMLTYGSESDKVFLRLVSDLGRYFEGKDKAEVDSGAESQQDADSSQVANGAAG